MPTRLHLWHGRDDFEGGLVRVTSVTPRTLFDGTVEYEVEVEEDPGTFHNWTWLAPQQDKLREEYGDNRGHPDPDHRPEFNEG